MSSISTTYSLERSEFDADPFAGKSTLLGKIVDRRGEARAIFLREPTDLKDQSWLVAIGTSGRRGTPLQGTIAEAHILVVSQAICDDRHRHDTDGKMLFHNGLIDRVVRKLGRQLSEVPVGFKWFTSELFDGSCRFGGEESAGTSHLRDDFRAPAVGVGSLLEAAIMLARMRGDRGCRLERSIPDPLAS